MALTTSSWFSEAQRKAIHFSCIILALGLLYEWLPWPRGRNQWMLALFAAVVGAVALDLLRIHDHRVTRFFRKFLGEIIREHERFNLLGSTYLLIAALIAVAAFPQPLAAAALGFAVLGDGLAAMVGKAWGRTRVFNKTIEGALGCLVGCLAWSLFLAGAGFVPLSVAVAGAFVATLVEILPIPLDDNLGIPLFAGFAMRLLAG
jgi:dolichol kinase